MAQDYTDNMSPKNMTTLTTCLMVPYYTDNMSPWSSTALKTCHRRSKIGFRVHFVLNLRKVQLMQNCLSLLIRKKILENCPLKRPSIDSFLLQSAWAPDTKDTAWAPDTKDTAWATDTKDTAWAPDTKDKICSHMVWILKICLLLKEQKHIVHYIDFAA